MEGWIKLHRKTQENWLWNEKRKFSKFEAWLDLLLRANHRDTKTMVNGKVVSVKRGSFITSEVKLSEQWNWDRKTVRRFLIILKDEKMIQKNATSEYTSISIENWDLYQNNEQQKEQLEVQQEGQAKDSRRDTDKNVKNVNNEKNENNNISTSEEKSSSVSVKASKHKYGEYKNVLLKDKELQDLQKEYQNWKELITYLDEYIEMKGYKAKSHYLCIKKWVVDAVKKQTPKTKQVDSSNLDECERKMREKGLIT